ncbi:MAG: 16S rRNA (cytosine(967)-C(5))-methyltransferase RsmB [Candidatus Limivicinus sp.]
MNAREAALAVLDRCRRDGAWSGAAIDNIIKKAELDRRDGALASRLSLGVMQNCALCDYYIGCYCSCGIKKLEPRVLDIIRLGVYQLLFLDRVPARAAVNESVALCRSSGCSRAAGLVNAVLRRISENTENLPEIKAAGDAELLSIKYSHPQWIVERIIAEKGADFAEHFLQCNNEPSALSIVVNTLKCTAEEYKSLLSAAGIQFKCHPFLSDCLILDGGSVTELPGYEDGFFYVQDSSARTAVEIAAPKRGMMVLDACAAPGGKSFSAAILMHNEGSILSCDIHEKKLRLVREGARRLGIAVIETLARDARQPDGEMDDKFDLVLADVPCSGFGLMGKKPEIRYKKESEIAGLPKIQLEILKNLASFVKPGGHMVYSTCTILRAENEAVVEQFLKENKNFAAEEFSIGDIRSAGGMYTFWPNIDSGDGFFTAKLVRTK